MKRVLFGYVLFTITITLAILYPYSTQLTDTLPNAIDPVFYAWNLGHNTQSALAGGKNLLDTNIFYPEGNTLALSDTLYAETLFTFPIIIATQNPVLAQNLYILSTFVLSALAMFFLSYHLTRHVIASTLAGVFFAFSYPRLTQIGHMPAISSQWIPLYIVFLLKYLETGSTGNLWLTFLFYLLNVTSSIYFGIFLVPVTTIALFVKGFPWIRAFKSFAVSLLPMLIILFVVLFPYIRLRAEYPGIKRGIDDTARLGAKIRDYRTVLPTSWLSDLGMRTATNEEPLYPTLTLAILAAMGTFFCWKTHKKYVVFFTVTGISSLLLSFGPYIDVLMGKYQWFHLTAPYYYLYRILPVLQIVRVPARLSIIVMLSLSALAAIGLSKLLSKKYAYPTGALLLLLYLTEVWQVGTPSVTIPTKNNLPQVYQWLARQPDDSIVVELPLRPEWNSLRMEDQLMLEYRDTNENYVYALEAYRTYFSTFHRKRMLNGYSGYFPNVYHDHTIVFDTFPTQEAITILEKRRVRFILIHADQYVNIPYSEIKRQIQHFPELKLVDRFGTDYVYEIR